MNKTTYEEYLRQYGKLTYTNAGTSMLPMLKQGRDMFTLTAKTAKRCQKYEVVLYRRSGQYVLHRIVEVRERDYVILGDNCMNKEYGITDADILAVLTKFVRNGKEISVTDTGYLLYAKLWYGVYPVRRCWMKWKTLCRRLIRRRT